MTEQPTREPFRPRVWWSPTQGVIEQVEPRWPDEPMRCVRTRDRYVVPVSDDAVELRTAPEPTGDAVEVAARVLYDTANRDIGDTDPWEECGYRDVYRGMARAAIAAMPQQGDAEQYRHLLGCIWLYVDWKYVTRQLTTVQKELWADAVDVFGDPADRGPKAARWWRDDYAACEEPVCDGELECGDYADPITKRCKAHTAQDGEQHG